jgi:hypothetical protein
MAGAAPGALGGGDQSSIAQRGGGGRREGIASNGWRAARIESNREPGIRARRDRSKGEGRSDWRSDANLSTSEERMDEWNRLVIFSLSLFFN